jgi:hypothetical protein
MFRFILCSSLLVACPSLSSPTQVLATIGGLAWFNYNVALDLIGAFFILVPATDVFAFDATKTNLVCFFVRLLVFWRFSVLCVPSDSRLVLTGFNF